MLEKISVGDAVKNLRKCKEMTQGELAEAAGVTQGFISQVERGTSCPTPPVAHVLFDILGITEEERRAIVMDKMPSLSLKDVQQVIKSYPGFSESSRALLLKMVVEFDDLERLRRESRWQGKLDSQLSGKASRRELNRLLDHQLR